MSVRRIPLALGMLGIAALSLRASPSGERTVTTAGPQAAPTAAPTAAGGGGNDVITFEGTPAGTILDTVFSEGGAGPISVLGTNPAFPGQNAAVVFDSSNPTGGDPDLGTPNEDFGGPGIGAAGEMGSPFQNDVARGNIMILAEDLTDMDGDGLVDDPDDADLRGATLTITFPFVVDIKGMTVIDVEPDELAPTVSLFDANEDMIAQLILAQPGDNGVEVLTGSIKGVVNMVLTLNGSGGFDELVFEQMDDCNNNLIPDDQDIEDGTSLDCNLNGIPDECEEDCNGNLVPDDCDIADGTSDDCNANGIPDDCEDDCNGNGIPDDCDVANGTSPDANDNGTPDECEPCDPDDLSIEGAWILDNGIRHPEIGITLNRFRPAGGERVDLDFEHPESLVWMVTTTGGHVCIFGQAMRVDGGGPTGERVYLDFCYEALFPEDLPDCDKVGRRETGAPMAMGPIVGSATWLPTGHSVSYFSKSDSSGTFMKLSAKPEEDCEFVGIGWLSNGGNADGDWFFGIPCVTDPVK